MVDILHDIAGALLVEAPTMADYDSDEIGDDVREHLGRRERLVGRRIG